MIELKPLNHMTQKNEQLKHLAFFFALFSFFCCQPIWCNYAVAFASLNIPFRLCNVLITILHSLFYFP